jgi:hypothetical protein
VSRKDPKTGEKEIGVIKSINKLSTVVLTSWFIILLFILISIILMY